MCNSFGHIEGMKNPISEAKARVRAAIDAGTSAPALARRAGLHRNALYAAGSPEWDPKSSTLEKLWPHLEA